MSMRGEGGGAGCWWWFVRVCLLSACLFGSVGLFVEKESEEKSVTLNIVEGLASHGRKAGAGGGCMEKEPGGGHDHVLMLFDGFRLSELACRLIEELKNKKKNEKSGPYCRLEGVFLNPVDRGDVCFPFAGGRLFPGERGVLRDCSFFGL